MSNCTCGKTTRPPFCDGSHWLSDEDYLERTKKLEKLFKKPVDFCQKDNAEEKIKETSEKF